MSMNFFRRRNSQSKTENKSRFMDSQSISHSHNNHSPNYNFQHSTNSNNNQNINHTPSPLSNPSSNNSINSGKNINYVHNDIDNEIKPNKYISPKRQASSHSHKSNSKISNSNSNTTSNSNDHPPSLISSLGSDSSSLFTPINVNVINDHDDNKYKRKQSSSKRKKKSSIFHSQSVSHSSVAISAHGMLSISNSALSLLDYGIERTDVEAVVMQLMDLIFSIGAVWVVARPIDRASMATRRFEHWCVKIHAQPALISMDFFESAGKGAFGISSVCASWTELEDFLTYYITEYDTGKQVKKPWKILSSVVPKKYDKITNLEQHMLPLEIGKHNMNAYGQTGNDKNDDTSINKIKCDYKVRDIAEFIEEWVDDHKSYNSLATNCQRFAYDVFKFIIGDHYPHKVKLLDKYFQSPLDRQKEKLNRLKNNENPDLESNETIIISDDCDESDDDDNKQEDKQLINTYTDNKNNPEARVLVQSIDATTMPFINKLDGNKNGNDNSDLDLSETEVIE